MKPSMLTGFSYVFHVFHFGKGLVLKMHICKQRPSGRMDKALSLRADAGLSSTNHEGSNPSWVDCIFSFL